MRKASCERSTQASTRCTRRPDDGSPHRRSCASGVVRRHRAPLFHCRRLLIDKHGGALSHLRKPENLVDCMTCLARARRVILHGTRRRVVHYNVSLRELGYLVRRRGTVNRALLSELCCRQAGGDKSIAWAVWYAPHVDVVRSRLRRGDLYRPGILQQSAAGVHRCTLSACAT